MTRSNESVYPGIPSFSLLNSLSFGGYGANVDRTQRTGLEWAFRMVQEPRVCVDILQQLAAAEAALNRISLAVLRHHVEKCVPDGIVQGEPEKTKRLA